MSLSDQVIELRGLLKQQERVIHHLEEAKKKLVENLEDERLKYRQQCDPRILTAEDRDLCKHCVQDLLTVAKEALAYETKIVNELMRQHNHGTSATVSSAQENKFIELEKEKIVNDIQDRLEQSQDQLYAAVELMDRAILVELCAALGGLVQTLYIDREKSRMQYEQFQTLYREKEVNYENTIRLLESSSSGVNTSHRMGSGNNLTEMNGGDGSGTSSSNAINSGLNGATGNGVTSGLGTNGISGTSQHIYGLDIDEETLRVLLNGLVVLKHCRFGQKKGRIVSLTPDLLNICWRQLGNMTSQRTIPLHDFSRYVLFLCCHLYLTLVCVFLKSGS